MEKKVTKRILSAIYEQLIEELPPTQECKKIQEKFEKKRKEFLENLEKQNSETLENLTDTYNEMNNELNKQVFFEGFSLAVELFLECTYKERDN